MRLTRLEKAALIIGSAGLFIIAIVSVFGIIILSYQTKPIPPSLAMVVGIAITGGIASLEKIGKDNKDNPEE